MSAEPTTMTTMARAGTLWLTGLSGAGKTTLAEALVKAFDARGTRCRVLDGDVVRRELSADLGFSKADRHENIRRVAVRCQALNEDDTWVIAALISPYREDRELAQRTIGAERFTEIYLATPLSICEARDPKGLYRRARAGEISNFTGISDPYEPPLTPALTFDSGVQSIDACVDATMAWLDRAAMAPTAEYGSAARGAPTEPENGVQ